MKLPIEVAQQQRSPVPTSRNGAGEFALFVKDRARISGCGRSSTGSGAMIVMWIDTSGSVMRSTSTKVPAMNAVGNDTREGDVDHPPAQRARRDQIGRIWRITADGIAARARYLRTMWDLATFARLPCLSFRRCLLRACGTLMMLGLAWAGAMAGDPAKVVGPNACAECHKEESKSWAATHHFKTFRELPRRQNGKAIAKNMGIRRIRSEGMCLGCHYTVQNKAGRQRAVAGISCESCHGAAGDWVKVHGNYSGKTKQTETPGERAARWKQAEASGMIRPSALYRLAKNCFACHVVPQEKLVNVGGHPAGSPFEMVSWSQGEVRHNTWHNEGKANSPADAKRKRMLFLVGLGVELETGIRAVSTATERSLYAFAMARRVDRARGKLTAVAKAVPNVPEIPQLISYAYAAGLKLNNKGALTAAADSVAGLIKTIAKKYDGAALAGLDALIPGPDKFKGKVLGAGASN